LTTQKLSCLLYGLLDLIDFSGDGVGYESLTMTDKVLNSFARITCKGQLSDDLEVAVIPTALRRIRTS
jgi:hypothetical protein